jgi:DNA adenine methylase
MAGALSRWWGGIEGLPDIALRLTRVQIENRRALKLIEKADGPETLFYCDPPYANESRGDKQAYGFEMSDSEHRKLAEALHRCVGKVAISGYRGALMDELYAGWQRHEQAVTAHSVKAQRTEVLWMNYQPDGHPRGRRAVRRTGEALAKA